MAISIAVFLSAQQVLTNTEIISAVCYTVCLLAKHDVFPRERKQYEITLLRIKMLEKWGRRGKERLF